MTPCPACGAPAPTPIGASPMENSPQPVTTGRQFFPVGTPVRYHDSLAAEPSACVETLDGPLLEESFSPGDCGTYVGTSRAGRGSFPVVAVRINERDLLAVVPPHVLVEMEPRRSITVHANYRVGNLDVGIDDSNCIVIVDRRTTTADHTITVTDVNRLKAALDFAVISQQIEHDLPGTAARASGREA